MSNDLLRGKYPTFPFKSCGRGLWRGAFLNVRYCLLNTAVRFVNSRLIHRQKLHLSLDVDIKQYRKKRIARLSTKCSYLDVFKLPVSFPETTLSKDPLSTTASHRDDEEQN